MTPQTIVVHYPPSGRELEMTAAQGHELVAEIEEAIGKLPRRGTCCACPVERHAYNGCADCDCAVSWIDPDRELDTSVAGTAANKERARKKR